MTPAALVSAVVTSFGGTALIRRCRAALVDQSPLEIIVADGSAHDPSAWIARALSFSIFAAAIPSPKARRL